MKIQIIQIGKNKDKYIEEGSSEFLKRLKAFASLEVKTLKEVGVSKSFGREKCVEEEGWEILKVLDQDSFVVVLDERGKEFNSKEFGMLLGKQKDSGVKITFVIGGPFGLSDEVKRRANLLLAFSKMTFTHQMIRLFLLEQIYRGFAIIHNREYHHE